MREKERESCRSPRRRSRASHAGVRRSGDRDAAAPGSGVEKRSGFHCIGNPVHPDLPFEYGVARGERHVGASEGRDSSGS